MKALLIAAFLMFAALASGCRENKSEDYVALSGRIFVFNYRIAEANFVVTLAKLKPTPEGAKVVGHFDDPAGGNRIIIEKKIWTNNDKIVLESRALNCIVRDRPYRFDVEIIDGKGRVMQKLSSSVTSTLDQGVLPDKPHVVGPGYEPNPELKGHAVGKVSGMKKRPCPQD